MVTYVLQGESQAHLPRRPLSVTMSVQGQAGSAALIVRNGEFEEPSAIVHSAGMVILPRVDHDITLYAVPGPGHSTFPAGTTIFVSIGLDSARDPDPDIASLTALDVSGLDLQKLATVAPDGDRTVVRTELEKPELQLEGLAARARASARQALGVHQVSESGRISFDVLVDTSVSMLGAIREGSVLAVVDILVGVSTVLSPDIPPRVRLVGHSVTDVPEDETQNLGIAVQRRVESIPLGVGFTGLPSSDARSVQVLITDSVPQKSTAVSATTQRPVVAMVATASSRSASVAGTSSVRVPISSAGEETTQYLLALPDSVESTVRSLLRELHVEGLVGSLP